MVLKGTHLLGGEGATTVLVSVLLQVITLC